MNDTAILNTLSAFLDFSTPCLAWTCKSYPDRVDAWVIQTETGSHGVPEVPGGAARTPAWRGPGQRAAGGGAQQGRGWAPCPQLQAGDCLRQMDLMHSLAWGAPFKADLEQPLRRRSSMQCLKTCVSLMMRRVYRIPENITDFRKYRNGWWWIILTSPSWDTICSLKKTEAKSIINCLKSLLRGDSRP